MFLRPGYPGKPSDVIFSSRSTTWLISHTISSTSSAPNRLLCRERVSFFQWWEVVALFRAAATAQIKRQAGISLHSREDSTRDPFRVGTKRKNVHPGPQARCLYKLSSFRGMFYSAFWPEPAPTKKPRIFVYGMEKGREITKSRIQNNSPHEGEGAAKVSLCKSREVWIFFPKLSLC